MISRKPIENVDYYDCRGKPDGKYPHPSDCTRYIMCHNGLAADMSCEDCNPNDPQCEGSPYLYYDEKTGWCDWPALVPCLTD